MFLGWEAGSRSPFFYSGVLFAVCLFKGKGNGEGLEGFESYLEGKLADCCFNLIVSIWLKLFLSFPTEDTESFLKFMNEYPLKVEDGGRE